MDNLKDKNEQTVLKYLEDIPEDDIEKFKLDMGWIREHKWSGLHEDVPVYLKFVKEGFNLLTANIADKVRRMERDSGKKVKLVLLGESANTFSGQIEIKISIENTIQYNVWSRKRRKGSGGVTQRSRTMSRGRR